MKLKELPPHVQKIALERMKERRTNLNVAMPHKPLSIGLRGAFYWAGTPEGHRAWSDICTYNDYTLFNNFHKITPHDKTQTETNS